MNLLVENDIEYPFMVTVKRPSGGFSEAGNYIETMATVIERMTADIQFSLKVRDVFRETASGAADNALWLMFCLPPAPILAGDRVEDGERVFTVDSVCDWGSHTECVMKKIS